MGFKELLFRAGFNNPASYSTQSTSDCFSFQCRLMFCFQTEPRAWVCVLKSAFKPLMRKVCITVCVCVFPFYPAAWRCLGTLSRFVCFHVYGIGARGPYHWRKRPLHLLCSDSGPHVSPHHNFLQANTSPLLDCSFKTMPSAMSNGELVLKGDIRARFREQLCAPVWSPPRQIRLDSQLRSTIFSLLASIA